MLELLDEFNVEIPIIQRDYVQGRQNAGVVVVRQKLLDDMRKALCKATPPLDLNFVYGKTDGKKFIPIDGQQRLTTLFLLHLYAFRNDESKTPLLEKFTYETRASSREFFKELVKNRGEIFRTNQDYPKPSDILTDSGSFVSSYNCDPTVQSALVMLDEIAALFGEVEGLPEALQQKEDPPISFNFLDIEKLGSEDSLYIKLNARGKSLTDFENFKAKLLGTLRTLTQALPFSADDFERKFDSDWTDLFWQRKGVEYEDEYRTFFEILLFNSGLIGISDENWVQTLNYEDIPIGVFICAFNLLNYLCDNYTDSDDDKDAQTDASSIVFKALDDPTASNRAAFHFVCVFLLKRDDLANSLAMHDWVRVFGNLVNNTLIDNYNTALDVIKCVNGFASDPDDLSDILSNIGKLKRGFDKEQLAEETKKAAVILAERKLNNSVGGEFEAAINSAEKLPFFSGQIRAGLYPAEDKDAPFGYDLQKFCGYWDALKKLFGDFNDKSSLKHGIKLRRALLSIDDYTLSVESYKTLCSDHTDARGSVSLKRLFSDCGDITTKLLDQVVGQSNIVDALNKIIDTNLKNIPQTDWRYCLIKYPDMFGCMSTYYYRIRFTDDKVLLVRNARSSGINFEVFSDALKREMEKRSIYLLYDSELFQDQNIGKTTDGDYFVIYKGAHGKRYFIRYSEHRFFISDSKKNEVFRSKSKSPITETADYIEKNLK